MNFGEYYLCDKFRLNETLILFYTLVAVSCAALSNDMKEEIVAVHNTLRRNFAKGSEGAVVGNMKKLVSRCHVLNLLAHMLLF